MLNVPFPTPQTPRILVQVSRLFNICLISMYSRHICMMTLSIYEKETNCSTVHVSFVSYQFILFHYFTAIVSTLLARQHTIFILLYCIYNFYKFTKFFIQN